jgi:hypothetical protein
MKREKLTEVIKEAQEFEELAQPIIRWLKKRPGVSITVTHLGATMNYARACVPASESGEEK